MAQNEFVRDRCYGCFRPKAACFCAAIPRIDNRTEVLIVQHRRERFHPFNTARIVRQSLSNAQLLVDNTSNLALRLRLKPRAALLYPGPAVRLISDLSPAECPEQLVILDGTWHHAKTLLREIPALQSLPRYRLRPAAPSRYRIRREPSAMALSTVEAVVAALQILEPATGGLSQLLQAFETMVERQLAHPGSANGQRFRARRNRTFKNVPLALLGDLKNIVVAYGESAAGKRGSKRTEGPPISWVAQRLGTGEAFSCRLIPPEPLDDVFLGHLSLTRADFAEALSLDAARKRWSQFQRPTDVVAVFYPGTARLLSYLSNAGDDCIVLKAVDLGLESLQPELEPGGIARLEPASALPGTGRAGQRLAQAIAYLRYLNVLANSRVTCPR